MHCVLYPPNAEHIITPVFQVGPAAREHFFLLAEQLKVSWRRVSSLSVDRNEIQPSKFRRQAELGKGLSRRSAVLSSSCPAVHKYRTSKICASTFATGPSQPFFGKETRFKSFLAVILTGLFVFTSTLAGCPCKLNIIFYQQSMLSASARSRKFT